MKVEMKKDGKVLMKMELDTLIQMHAWDRGSMVPYPYELTVTLSNGTSETKTVTEFDENDL